MPSCWGDGELQNSSDKGSDNRKHFWNVIRGCVKGGCKGEFARRASSKKKIKTKITIY